MRGAGSTVDSGVHKALTPNVHVPVSSSLIDPVNWTAPPGREAFEDLRTRGPGSGSRWINDGSISPMDLYVYLKARFGEPNGFQMAFRTPGTDNLIQWHYSIIVETERMEIMGMNTRLEFMTSITLTRPEWAKLVVNLKEDFGRHGPAMSRVRAELERWKLFVNPYHRFDKIVSDHTERLQELNFNESDLPSPPDGAGGREEYYESMEALGERIQLAAKLGTVLRMMAPVLGEAFVNVVIFLLAKTEIKKDQRLYDDLIRREIDVRTKRLSLDCEGFAKQVDGSSDEVRAFLRVMNARNDFLHGNVDPHKLESGRVFFDGTIPLFERDMSLAERGYLPALKHVEPRVALKDVEDVRAFIEYVLSCLEEQIRPQVEQFLEEMQPGWREDTGRAGILFPQWLADMTPIFEDESEAHSPPPDTPRT